MKRNIFIIALAPLGLLACATSSNHHGTLAELDHMPADIDEVYVEDSLERAAESYQRYLEETPKSARTPEAMRRLADLQIEQAYGVMGSGEMMEMAAPDAATQAQRIVAKRQASHSVELSESEQAFEARATERETLLAQTSEFAWPTALGTAAARHSHDFPKMARDPCIKVCAGAQYGLCTQTHCIRKVKQN